MAKYPMNLLPFWKGDGVQQIAEASNPDAGPLTGAEYATVSRGSGVLKTTLTAIAQWVLRHWNAAVTPEMYGTTDTPANTAAAFNAAAAACLVSGKKLMAGAPSYTLGADVNLRSVKVDMSAANIAMAGTSVLTIGGNAGTTLNPKQVFGDVYRQGSNWSLDPATYPTPCLRVIGAKGQDIHVGHTDRVNFYMSTDPATYPADASQAYSTFHFRLAIIIDISTNPAYDGGPQADGPGSANQWFNENTFYLGRCINFLMNGSYRHNNNRIFGGCMETDKALINVQSGNKNRFENMRFEGAANITFGANTQGNIIEALWYSSESYAYADPVNNASGVVTDLGYLNIIKNVRNALSYSDIVFDVNCAFDMIHNGQTGNYSHRMVTRRNIRGNARNTSWVIAESDTFDMVAGDYVFTRCYSLASAPCSYITRFYFYDENKTLIVPTAEMFETSNFNQFFSDRVEGRTYDTAHARMGILNSAIKYCRMQLINPADLINDNAVRFLATRVSRNSGRNRNAIYRNSKQQNLVNFTTSKPTAFVGALGDIVPGTAADYRCTFMLETTLTATAAAAATTISVVTTTVAGYTGIAVGDLVGIDLDDGTTHWTTVASGSTSTAINLAAGLPSGAASGLRVYVSRLADR